jgi:glucose-6-phosphate 1-dehydrogenase
VFAPKAELGEAWRPRDPPLKKLVGLLRYVDGDYQDPATFTALRKEFRDAQRPAHYLAIPPVLFETVVRHLADSNCGRGARVIVEKPFGHDLASAQELNKVLLSVFDEARAIFRIDHYLGKRAETMCWRSVLPMHSSRAF